jgi:hypothetical protein
MERWKSNIKNVTLSDEEEIGNDRISVALCLIGYDTYQRKNNEFGEAFTIQGLLASY